MSHIPSLSNIRSIFTVAKPCVFAERLFVFSIVSRLNFCYNIIAGQSCRGVAIRLAVDPPFFRGGSLFHPPTLRKEGMLMTVFEIMALLSFSIAVFQLGYLFGSEQKKKK